MPPSASAASASAGSSPSANIKPAIHMRGFYREYVPVICVVETVPRVASPTGPDSGRSSLRVTLRVESFRVSVSAVALEKISLPVNTSATSA